MSVKLERCRIVFKPSVARTLLHNGCPIVDIKQHRHIENKTVFVFEETEKFLEIFNKLKNN